MKHIKRFNESQNGNIVTLTKSDVDKLGYNGKVEYELYSNFGFDDDQTLEADFSDNIHTNWQNNEVSIGELIDKTGQEEIGYAIKVNGHIKYLITIYEPHGCSFDNKRGYVIAYGHEEITTLSLEDGEFNTDYTR